MSLTALPAFADHWIIDDAARATTVDRGGPEPAAEALAGASNWRRF